MSYSPMVGARVPEVWQLEIKAIALAAGRKEAEIVRDAIAQYLGKTDPTAVKGAIAKRCCKQIASLEDRLASVERKLAGLGRLVG